MITIYEKDATDFTNNGLGALAPSACEVSETLNGQWEVTMTHPLDDLGKWQRIALERIIRVPVPAGRTPAVTVMVEQQSSEQVDMYQIANVGAEYNGYLNMRTQPNTQSSIIGSYPNGTKVIRLDNTTENYFWHVSTPDGKKGYMNNAPGNMFTHIGAGSVPISTAVKEVLQPKDLREQPFRIYDIEPGLNELTVKARHIFYDLRYNLIQNYTPDANATGAEVFRALATHCMSPDHGFNFYSTLTSTAKDEVKFENTYLADAMMNQFVENYGGEIARDWYDVYMVDRVGYDTEFEVRYGKNLLSLGGSINNDKAVTYIMPVGQDKDGNALYHPDTYFTAPDHDVFAIKRWYVLNVEEAKEGSKDSNDHERTKADCYQLMEDAVDKLIEEGCDAVEYTVTVDFLNLPDTEEYKQLALKLTELAMGDGVRIVGVPTVNNMVLRLTDYTYNCLTRKYTSMTLGVVEDTLADTPIDSSQLPVGGISGKYLGRGSVGVGAIGNGAVVNGKLADGTITATKIHAGTITANEIASGSISADRIAAHSLTTDQIQAGGIDADRITSHTITSDQIEAGSITGTEIAGNTITGNHIQANSITAQGGQLANGAVTNLAVADGVITNAKISSAAADRIVANKLVIAGSDGIYYQLNVTAQGIEPEAMDETNSVLGSTITPNTITASKINAVEVFSDTVIVRELTAAITKTDMLVPISAALGDARQLLLGTKKLFKWTHGGSTTFDTQNGIITHSYSGAVDDTWLTAKSPVTPLQDDTFNDPNLERKMTLSFDVYSDRWADVDAGTSSGIYVGLRMMTDSAYTEYDSLTKWNIIAPGGKWGVDAGNQVAGANIVNSVWHRVFCTFTLTTGKNYTGTCVTLNMRRNGTMKYRHAKLEWGDIDTSWDTSLLDEEFYAGSKITMNEDEVDIRTERFSVTNASTQMTFDKNGLNIPSVQIGGGEAITGNVVQYYNGAMLRQIHNATELIQLTNELRRRYINGTLTIEIMDSIAANPVFSEIMGGTISVYNSTHAAETDKATQPQINGSVSFVNCTSRVYWRYVNVARTTSPGSIVTGAFIANNCPYVAIVDCVITSASGMTGITSNAGSHVNIFRCTFRGGSYASLADGGSIINYANSDGQGTVGSSDRTGITTVDSRSTSYMPYPYNHTTWYYTDGAQVLGTPHELRPAGGTPAPTPTVYETTVNADSSRRVAKASNSNYYDWTDANVMTQGVTWDSGVTTWYTGVARFVIPSTIQGTIQNVSLTLHRNTGLSTSGVTITAYKLSGTYYNAGSQSAGATHNSTVIGSASGVVAGSDVTFTINKSVVTKGSTLYIVFDTGERSITTGSESPNAAYLTRANSKMYLTISSRA